MSPRNMTRLRWSLLALAGLIAAVAVGVAAAALTSSRIGLSSEPIRAGEALAPKSVHKEDRRHGGRGRDHPEDGAHHGGDDSTTTTAPTTTVPTTTTAPPATTTAPPATTTTPPTSTSDDSDGHEDGDDD